MLKRCVWIVIVFLTSSDWLPQWIRNHTSSLRPVSFYLLKFHDASKWPQRRPSPAAPPPPTPPAQSDSLPNHSNPTPSPTSPPPSQPNSPSQPPSVGPQLRIRDRKLTKPELGHLQKADVIPMRHLQEFRLQSVDGFETSQKLDFQELFKEGDLVDVAGDTIGKGFQGGIKRHNFKRGQMTHGSKSHRALGSIGAGTTPGRVYKGKKMPGRMGGTKTKIRKLPIVKIDNELRVVMIKGALPGKPGNLLRITPAKIVGKNIPKN
ncbi:unnamed protein product [Rhodiola kirilowii]